MPYRFLDGGDQEVGEDNLSKYPVVIVGEEATGDPDLGRAFEAVPEFRRWAATTRVAAQVEEVYTTLAKQIGPEHKHNAAWVQKMQTLALKKKSADFAEFAKLVGAEPGSEEVIRRAMIERTPLTPQVFDPILLWDRRIEVEPPQGAPQDPHTRMLPVGSGWWPVLGWVGWDNAPRSARVFGLNILCDGNWFSGRWCWLIGFNMLVNLDRVGFDRMASSLISH